MWHWLAQTADPTNLTLPAYGICGIVIAGLSTACLKLYNRVTFLSDQATLRERQMSDEVLPMLIKSIQVLSSAAPHIERAGYQSPPQDPPADEMRATLRRMQTVLDGIEARDA